MPEGEAIIGITDFAGYPRCYSRSLFPEELEAYVAYDDKLADRVRDLLVTEHGVTERKMFGGLAFMVRGHMACGILGDELVLRLGADGAKSALERPHVRPMDFTGSPMTSMVFVGPAGLRGVSLRRWVGNAVSFVASLPPKRQPPEPSG